MSPFGALQKDVVYIEKVDGSRLGPFKTALGRDSASIFESEHYITEGDKVVRELPGGVEESYVITSAHFSPGLTGIPAHYALKFRKITGLPDVMSPKQVTVNISNSSGVQVGDHNVINIQNALHELVQRIESADGQPEQKAEAKSRLNAFLSHPLVTAILGGAVGAIPTVLGQ